MNKELILLEDVEGLGKIGDIVKVAPGYARNFLLPKGKAQIVNKGTLRQVEARKLKLQKEHEERVNVAKAMADKLAKLELVFPVAVGENDKLYGSVSAIMIADAAKAQGIEIEKSIIDLDNNLNELGDFTVAVKLHPEVKASVKVKVVRKEGDAEAK
jgi:large subunit ribosomal protein L9